jgi:hypothetical protein
MLAWLAAVLDAHPDARRDGRLLVQALVEEDMTTTRKRLPGRPRSANRDDVLSPDVRPIPVRFTPREQRALHAIVAYRQRAADEAGIGVHVSVAGVLRDLVRREAERIGAWGTEDGADT